MRNCIHCGEPGVEPYNGASDHPEIRVIGPDGLCQRCWWNRVAKSNKNPVIGAVATTRLSQMENLR